MHVKVRSIDLCRVVDNIEYAFLLFFFFFQAEDGIRDGHVTGVQTCALPISPSNCMGTRLLTPTKLNAGLSSILNSILVPPRIVYLGFHFSLLILTKFS